MAITSSTSHSIYSEKQTKRISIEEKGDKRGTTPEK